MDASGGESLVEVNMKKLLLSLVLVQGLVAAPIHNAVIAGNLARVEEILREDRSLVNAVSEEDTTPLGEAAYHNHINLVRLLLDFGANVGEIGTFGGTPLHIAVQHGGEDIINLLLDYGADVNATDAIGNNPLNWAISQDNTEAVRTLIFSDVNVNAIDEFGDTPVHCAARFSYTEHSVEIARLFISHTFCNHTIANKNGKSPEDIARESGYIEMANILHNAPSVNKKILNTGNGLKYFTIRYLNRIGITQAEKDSLPRELRDYITNIRESNYNDDGEPGPSGYHTDGSVSSIDTEDLEQESYCSIQ